MAAPGHLHGLEPGHPPLWPPQYGGLTAVHSPLLKSAFMAAFFSQSKSLGVCAQLPVRCHIPGPHLLGTSLHPSDVFGCKTYSETVQVAWPASFHFADVERIAAFQMAHLRAQGVSDPQNWPQAKIAATEQGWNVCSASILMPVIHACGSEI